MRSAVLLASVLQSMHNAICLNNHFPLNSVGFFFLFSTFLYWIHGKELVRILVQKSTQSKNAYPAPSFFLERNVALFAKRESRLGNKNVSLLFPIPVRRVTLSSPYVSPVKLFKMATCRDFQPGKGGGGLVFSLRDINQGFWSS